MRYRTILVEREQGMLSRLAGNLKEDNTFELNATFYDVGAALGQSSVFRPNLFLIDVDDHKSAESIAGFRRLFPEAEILGLMSDWRPSTAEQVLRMGGRGCILKPFRTKEVKEALALYKRRGQALPTRTLAFFSPKGHSGRTTLASVMALELARKSGEAVAIIDADLQFGDVAMFFDVVPTQSVVEASHDIRLLTPVTLEPYFHPVGKGVWIMAGPVRPEHAELVEADRLIDVVRMAGSLFRYVLIDLPAGFNPISLALAEFADTDFLMAMVGSGQEVRHMKRSMKMFQMWDSYGKKIYTLFNRVNPCTGIQQKKLEEEFGRPVTKILPEEQRIAVVTGSGRLVKDLPESTPFVQDISKLAGDIAVGRR